MATYVLVPGAWLGGWVWHDVAARLRGAGHEVYPISLTGLGERVHLARPDIDLETHITDVVNVMIWNDLRDVILIGHSFAGIVVTGVADRIPERLRALVYLDSAPLDDGQAMTDLFPPEALTALQQAVDAHGDGWRLPFPGFDALGEGASLDGLGERERSLLEAKAVAQPWPTYTQPLRLQHGDRADVAYRRVLIACADMRGLVAAGVAEIVALTAPPWRYLELETGHWPMLSTPVELAERLDGLAAKG